MRRVAGQGAPTGAGQAETPQKRRTLVTTLGLPSDD